MNGYPKKKKCDPNKSVIKMSVIIKGVYYTLNILLKVPKGFFYCLLKFS
jgi:hypothetical protein